MKTKAICSFFVLFAIVAGIVATTPAAFADHSEVTIETAPGSGAPGCEDTAEGCYIPSTATVDVGGKVIMSNVDTAAHTFTAGTPEDGPSGKFDTGLLMAGNSFEWSPDTIGEVPYFCMVHPWMQGLIVVQEAEAMDEHDDEHDDEMMGMEGAATATGMLSDGTMVSIWTSTPTAGEAMEISIEFEDAEHVNHDMMVTQNGVEVLMDEGAHHHEGTGMHTTAPLTSSDPVDITVTFQGYGVEDPKTGPIGEEVVFSNVVPEFGTIAMMVLAVAIISIVAVTAKSRVIPRF
ncbi:MAG: PEFG-CTERM sorting domain-containing protein [Nitrosopumilus sp.]|uniref:PEFG-CTERM sorting domain-containing protein n=1 Tax=Nitrosopumilus sp. TaxID=2024843 RepID=UPI00242F7BBD|nr:PEFG-CTERM sorting domain-containing protein [Nitrosopumilus sp.]MCV0365833.1 PEFG-CTERM sorting domain-containing protein [Nitrosopumilus sp.]